ncbi:hypothetical protein [uncultured Chryseobacterium sp.]|uniref:hypothetical protein n=1 Tax=uncultured Chryseobacterium sp. TaxID=259322 RepID=UPI0025D01B90|nr:hypothetical protein [uncultured Chryseobacterium sp.]
MKKNTTLLMVFASTAFVFGQVGVNTTSPKSTFDISLKRTGAGVIADNSQVFGLQAPRLTRAEITDNTATYGTDQNGALIYITDVSGGNANAGSQRENITSAGYYYFDGAANKWQKVSNTASGGTSYTVSNGLTLSGNDIQLGGSLSSDTSVAQGTHTMSFTSAATSGTSHFTVDGSTLNVDAVNNRIGVGTSSPQSRLEVNGSSTNTSAYDAGSGTTIDYTQSNLAYTTADPGSFTLNGIKDGGTYTLSVRGTASGTSTFTSSGFTVKYANNRATVSGKETVYTFLVMGSIIYVYTATGF